MYDEYRPDHLRKSLEEFDIVTKHLNAIEPAIQGLNFIKLFSGDKSEREKLFWLFFNALKQDFPNITKDYFSIKSDYHKDPPYELQCLIINVANEVVIVMTDHHFNRNYERDIKIRASQYQPGHQDEYKIIWTNYLGDYNMPKL